MALSENEAAGMTVNERLVAAGLLTVFDAAVARRDVAQLHRLLSAVSLDAAAIASLIARVLPPGGLVSGEVARRFAPCDWQEATDLLQDLALPLLDAPERAVDRVRVQLALVKLAAGDLPTLRRWAREATVDWRDVLVAAGMADANWRQALAREGFAVPGGKEDTE